MTSNEDSATLQNRLDSLTFQLRCSDTEKKKYKDKVDELTAKNLGVREEYEVLEKKYKSGREELASLRNQVRLLQGEKERARLDRIKVHELEEKLQTYETIHVAINGTRQQLMSRLHDLNDYSPNAQQLVQVSEQLKRELAVKADDAKILHKALQKKTNENGELKTRLEDKSVEVIRLSNLSEKLREDLNHAENEREILKSKLAKLEEAIVSPSGDPKSSAISRLIREHPPPLSMNMTVNSPPTPKISSVKSCGLIGLKEPSLKRPALSQENAEPIRSGSLFGPKKAKFSSQPTMVSDRSGLYFNGLGGHSKSDEFPTSQKSGNYVLAKKNKGISRPKVIKPDKKTQTLNKYFKFDTP